MAFTERLQIDAPRTKVFDMIADARTELEWNDSVTKAELTSGVPIGQGSQFTMVNRNVDRGQEHHATVTRYERPERVEFAVTSKGMDIDIGYTFEESAGSTMAVGTFHPRPKGVMKLLLPLMMPMIKRDLAKQHAKLRRLRET